MEQPHLPNIEFAQLREATDSQAYKGIGICGKFGISGNISAQYGAATVLDFIFLSSEFVSAFVVFTDSGGVSSDLFAFGASLPHPASDGP
jgi:hypothetical protein